MLKVMAAASAPLLINVGSGRVRRGGSSSPTGTPLIVGAFVDTTEIVLEGCVGRAILVEKTCEDVELEDAEDLGDMGEFGDFGESGDLGESGDAVELGRSDVTIVVVVIESVTCGGCGAIAPMPSVVGASVNAAGGDEVVVVEVLRLVVLEDG